MKKINVFVPAAGLAERLRPISAEIPKPLLPVLGKTVLDMVLDKVSTLPVQQIGINVHHKWEAIRDHVVRSPYSGRIVIFHESQILGTGGALRNAADLLSTSTFLVHNADIISGIDLAVLLEHHRVSENIATLAVHDHPKINSVWIDRTGRVNYVGKDPPALREGLRAITFTGVAVYSPDFLRFLREGRSEVVQGWLSASSAGLTVGTLDVSGTYCNDIGTPEAYSSAVFRELDEEGETSYVDPHVECDRATVGSRTVIEKDSVLEGPALLQNCIILPGTRVRRGECIKNAIAGAGFRVSVGAPATETPRSASLVSAHMATQPKKMTFTLIGKGGSDRKYYRVDNQDRTAVLLECPRTDPDFHRQIVYSRFFANHSVPVPALLAEEPDADAHPDSLKNGMSYALFEDLGDVSLYSRIKCVRDPREAQELYKKTLDLLIPLHTVATEDAKNCPPPNFRLFDYNHLRWETDYFMEQFVCGTRGIVLEDEDLLRGEFDRLARQADAAPKTIVHRDFQSQNIMVTEGDTPRPIDYQGARIGPQAYDLVSLLWDPYTRLDDKMRRQLMSYYIDRINRYRGGLFDEAAFRRSVVPCRLQRHMQALGAYGFLTKEKGKKYFLKYVPLALSYLRQETQEARHEYPALCRLVEKL